MISAIPSLLGSLGLGFLLSAAYLLPLTAALLLLSVRGLAYRAHSRHGYRPLLLGTVAAVGILTAKFAWNSKMALYGAIGVLIVASAWNVWPRRMKAELVNLGGDDGCKETH